MNRFENSNPATHSTTEPRDQQPSWHPLMMSGLLLLLIAAMLHPFLPGSHDGLGLTLSWMVQVFGGLGLLMVPVGIPWLAYEWKKRANARRNRPRAFRAHWFVLGAMVTGIIPMLGVMVVAAGNVGLTPALLALVLWLFAMVQCVRKLKALKNSEPASFNPTPVYLVLLPVLLSLAQFLLARPLTDFSRNRAMTNSEELIQAIERHRSQFGRYPESLMAVHPDYLPSIAGIAQYHYARNGDAYDLVFEQPRFFFDQFGTREFVVYNKLDQHLIPSHASWILLWSKDQLLRNQGWYAVRDTSQPGWKSFWFD